MGRAIDRAEASRRPVRERNLDHLWLGPQGADSVEIVWSRSGGRSESRGRRRLVVSDGSGIDGWGADAVQAGDLRSQLAPASLDAIFMLDLVQYVPDGELRWALQACRAALSPGGVCCVLTPNAQRLRRDPRMTLPGARPFELAPLRALLADSFESVDAFAWNGVERLEQPTLGDDLYAIARAGDAYRMLPIEVAGARLHAVASDRWITSTLSDQLSLEDRFLFRARLHVRAAPDDCELQLLLRTADPANYFWTALRPRSLIGNPASLMLSSGAFQRIAAASWEDVTTLVIRVRSPSAGECDVRISDVRVLVS